MRWQSVLLSASRRAQIAKELQTGTELAKVTLTTDGASCR